MAEAGEWPVTEGAGDSAKAHTEAQPETPQVEKQDVTSEAQEDVASPRREGHTRRSSQRGVTPIPEEAEDFLTAPEPETGVQVLEAKTQDEPPRGPGLNQSRARNILKRALASGVIKSDSGNLFPPKKGPTSSGPTILKSTELVKTLRAFSANKSLDPNSRPIKPYKPRYEWNRDKMLTDNQKSYLRAFFHKEPCPYGHRVFGHAAALFGILMHDLEETNPAARRRKAEEAKQKLAEMPDPDYASPTEQRLAFHLTFSCLKYQKFIEDMLEDCSFFYKFPQLKSDHALVKVVLCDLQLRKFQLRLPLPGETLDTQLAEIEKALYSCKTKLNAALARSRIKAGVLTVDHLLPESVRKNEKFASNMNVCVWINSIKTTFQAVVDEFTSGGFILVQTEDELKGKTFLRDHHCADIIIFPGDLREFLETHFLCLQGHIIIQDKSSCLGPQSVRNLINLGDDVMHVNIGSGLTTGHLASLTNGSDTVVFGFGIKHDKHFRDVMDKMELIGCKGRVKIMRENFLEVNIDDERFKHIKVVLVSAECSRSGVANPVDFIVSEGEDMGILKDLSQGQLDEGRLGDLIMQHNNVFRHAMRFPHVQAVVYCTRSLHEAENDNIVTQGIEFVNMVQQKKTPFRIAPPVLLLLDHEIEKENPLVGKFLKYMPGPSMSACFLATITREADDPKQAAKDILARAQARGIISGVATVKDKKKGKGKGRRESVKPAAAENKEKKKSAKEKGSPKVSSPLLSEHSQNGRTPTKFIARLFPSPPSPTTSPKLIAAQQFSPEHTKIIAHPWPFK